MGAVSGRAGGGHAARRPKRHQPRGLPAAGRPAEQGHAAKRCDCLYFGIAQYGCARRCFSGTDDWRRHLWIPGQNPACGRDAGRGCHGQRHYGPHRLHVSVRGRRYRAWQVHQPDRDHWVHQPLHRPSGPGQPERYCHGDYYRCDADADLNHGYDYRNKQQDHKSISYGKDYGRHRCWRWRWWRRIQPKFKV